MDGGSSTSNAPKSRKRVEADTLSTTLKRARDGSAFARCEECKSSVPVALIDMHICSLEAKIKMNLEAQVVEKVAEVKKKPTEIKKNSGERKKSAASSESESKPKKRLRKSGDSNKPKRPLTAFFIFIADFRITFKEENHKLGGEKWKSLSVPSYVRRSGNPCRKKKRNPILRRLLS